MLAWISISAMTFLLAADAPKPTAAPIDLAKVSKIAIDPATVDLSDPRSKQRILVVGEIAGKSVDLTDVARLSLASTTVAGIVEPFELYPVNDGKTELVAHVGSLEAKATVSVSNTKSGRPISFPNEIIPIFSKLNCNSGGCHGKSGGQNNFSLSLLGYQPTDDYDYLVKEGRGRRIFPAAPEQSLLLRKAVGELPHGGGKLMKVGDDQYQLLVAWIRQGMPYGQPNDATVKSIEIFPARRVMDRNRHQRLRVTASYSDGRREDVTRFAQFQSNDDTVASVDLAGNVETHDLSGESAIMARFMGQVAVFRAVVPLGVTIDNPPAFTPRNYVDQFVSRKWSELGIAPSERTSDYQFIRRLHLDVLGKLPERDIVEQFVADTDPDKRDKWIDRLIASPEHASFFAMKWGAILQNKRGSTDDNTLGTHAMSDWLKDAIHKDMPYDQFVRAILTSTGTPDQSPPVVWFRTVRTSEENVDSVSQLFLGTRLQCARCHHHPFEKWGQDDYYGLAAYFTRIGRKRFETFASGEGNEQIFVSRGGQINHPRTGQVIPPKPLDGAPASLSPGDDPRELLVQWMTSPSNPFFAKALVNRMWGHFFSRGIVEPIDDMRVTNPASNPELLDALANDFTRTGYSMKHLLRTILRSSTYQLSSVPTKFNQPDKQNFARYYPKRLPAEVLLDAVDATTGIVSPLGFPGEMRAVDLPDEKAGSYFLDIFGRPARSTSCECERSGEANLSQALHLLNSSDVHAKLIADGGRAAKLAADPRPDADKIKELFFVFFSRPPRPDELKVTLDHLAQKGDKKLAWQNIIWALLNTKEFQFNT